MLLILIFSSIIVVQAVQPNVYFEVYNKTKSANYTKVIYRCRNIKDSFVPLDIHAYFNILYENKIAESDGIVFGEKIMFISKDNNEFIEKSLMNNAGSISFSLNNKLNLGNILYCKITDIIERIKKCDLKMREIFGRFHILNAYEDDINLKVNTYMITTKFDVYFEIYEHKTQQFCDYENRVEFIYVVFAFLIVLSLIILFEIVNFVVKNFKSSRVHAAIDSRNIFL